MNGIEIPNGRPSEDHSSDPYLTVQQEHQNLLPDDSEPSFIDNNVDNRAAAALPRFSWTLVCLSCFGGLGGLLFGYDTGVISGALPYIRDDILKDYATDVGRLGWMLELIVSAAIVGAGVGSACGGFLADLLGRRSSLFLSDGLFAAGALLMAAASSVPALILGRVVVGLGVGLASVAVPLYIAEAAPATVRAVLVTVYVLMITTGQLLAYLLDFAFTFVPGTWRWMLGVAAVPAVVQFIGLIWLPESPRWLRRKGRIAAAVSAETQLLSDTVPQHTARSSDNADSLAEDSDSAVQPKLSTALRQPSFRRALVVGVGLQVLQQLCGINTVMYYAPVILETAGLANKQSAVLWSLLPAAVNAAGTVVGMLVIDTFGRRKLLLGSLAGVAGALAVLGTSFRLADAHSPTVRDDSGSTCVSPASYSLPATCAACLAANCVFCQPGGKTPGAGLCLAAGEVCPPTDFTTFTVGCPNRYSALILMGLLLYLACFSPGLGAVPWAVNAEIYAVQLAGLGGGIAATANWVTNALVSQTFLSLLYYVGSGTTFWLYAGIACLSALWVFIVLPETKGLSLDQVQNLFHGSGPTKEDVTPLSEGSGTMLGSPAGVGTRSP